MRLDEFTKQENEMPFDVVEDTLVYMQNDYSYIIWTTSFYTSI